MGINARSTLHPRWINSVQNTLDGFISCTISLYDQDLLQTGTDYDWRANTGATVEPTLLFSGPAQIQVYRFTLTMDAPVGSVDQTRNARFTINHEEMAGVVVRKGQRVFVDSCPHDPTLEKYQYVVNSGFNSGASFRRTIETEVDMARVMP
jgi:hypothetical protein